MGGARGKQENPPPDPSAATRFARGGRGAHRSAGRENEHDSIDPKPATACASTGMCRSRWMTASCCAPTCSARSRRQSIRSFSPTAPTPKASRSRTAIRARGSAWWRSIPTSRRARPTSIRAGRWSIRRNGCRTAMRACAWIRAAPAARPATSIISRRARPRISTTASNGPACSPGRTARSGSTASRITASTSGTSRRCSRRISPRCASGRARPTGIAT